MSLISDVLCNCHFVKKPYQPLYARHLIYNSTSNTSNSDFYDDLKTKSWEFQLYTHLAHADFEMAYDLSFNTSSSYKQHKELYDAILDIISPIKNYFKQGIEVVYTLEDVKYLFNKMNEDARAILGQIELDEDGKSTILTISHNQNYFR